MLVTDCRQHFEALRRGDAGGKSAQCGALNRRAVGQRVREGDPQFQRIGAGFNQRIDDFQRLLRPRIAEGDEGNKGAFLAVFNCANSVS